MIKFPSQFPTEIKAAEVPVNKSCVRSRNRLATAITQGSKDMYVSAKVKKIIPLAAWIGWRGGSARSYCVVGSDARRGHHHARAFRLSLHLGESFPLLPLQLSHFSRTPYISVLFVFGVCCIMAVCAVSIMRARVCVCKNT